MAKNKFYPAIIDGEVINIFKTWDECKPHVTGIKEKEIHYAGFPTLDKALNFIVGKTGMDADSIRKLLERCNIPFSESDIESAVQTTKENEQEEISYPEDALCIYVDGSYDKKQNKYSYAFCAVKNGQKIYEESGVGEDEEAAAMRQVAGEILAAEKAIEYAIEQGEFDVVIFYDYKGIEEWANKTWRAKNKITQDYQRKIEDYRNQIDIYFVKVKAHMPKYKSNSHNLYNNNADKLAKQALGLV